MTTPAPRYLGDHARLTPDKPAVIHGASGATLTYRELDERSCRLAQCLYALGLRRGDRFALLMENHQRYLEVCWAALRAGLQVVAVNRYLSPAEIAYIVEDSDARVLIASHAMRDAVATLPASPQRLAHLMIDGTAPGWSSYEDAVAAHPAQPLAEQWMGGTMLYSSGTTGRPKGVARALPEGVKVTDGPQRRMPMDLYGFDADTVYLSPAPMYHAAPLGYSLHTLFVGGTVVWMDKFDAPEALRMIERWRITHSQWVPTMFVRMLKLPHEDRHRFDLSSHRVAIHAAAPCPADVKRAMIDWWGPIIHEYYGATEGNGVTSIDTAQWLAHPGSVGQARMGVLHVCDESGRELPAGEAGLVYFERDIVPFAYHKDPEKTRRAQHPQHPTWTTLGDIGRLDDEGYLYLTDRQSFMIISGGVNIYPQQIEDALALHPAVADVAVVGVPDADMGEAVKAVVQLAPGQVASDAMAAGLIESLRGRIGRHMIPRSVDFVDELPRLPTGKLKKGELRARYWPVDSAGPAAATVSGPTGRAPNQATN